MNLRQVDVMMQNYFTLLFFGQQFFSSFVFNLNVCSEILLLMTFGIYQDRIGRGAAWSKDQKKKRGKQGEPVLAWSFVDGWRFATKLDLFGLLCALCRLTSWWMKPRGSCKRLPFWQKTTKLMKNAQNNKSPSLKPKTKSYWSIKLINVTHCKK